MNDTSNGTTKIREFLYLDNDKLTSLSSQLFEGFLESVSEGKTKTHTDREDQKGIFGSGETLSNLLTSSTSREEHRVLSDHAFALLENELVKRKLLSEHGDDEPEQRFVRVKGKALIQDIPYILDLFDNFNKLGRDIITTQILDPVSGAMKLSDEFVGDRNDQAKHKVMSKSRKNIENLARENGMQLDETFLAAIKDLMDRSHKDALELMIPVEHKLYTAPLKKACLREDIDLIVRKFGRCTEIEFRLVGSISRSGKETANKFVSSTESVRGALFTLQGVVDELDSVMNNLLDNEVIVDPIAVYIE